MTAVPSILIIDPDETRRDTLSQQLLKTAGFTVAAVDSLEAAPPGRFGVVVLSASSADQPSDLRAWYPASPLIYLSSRSGASPTSEIPPPEGVFAILPADAAPETLAATVRRAMEHHRRLEAWSFDQAAGDLFPTRPDGIVLTDTEGRLRYANEAALAFLKLPPDGWEGRPLQKLVDLPQLFDARLISPQTTGQTFLIQTSGREPHTVQVTDLQGTGTLITFHNIAHYKEIETLRTELMQSISHDLRSPLTAILGYIELITKVGSVTAEQEEFIRRARISVNVITELIDSLLELSRIEADTEAGRGDVALPPILEECQIALQPLFDAKKQTVHVEMAPGLPEIDGRADRLRQMIRNLLENAHKYTEEHGQIHVRARREGSHVLFEVQDTGIGIPPSDLPFIFEKMYRAQNIPLEAPGSGLGLAIVKSIVENHGGRLWCDSVVGRGTTFTILLPVAPEKDRAG